MQALIGAEFLCNASVQDVQWQQLQQDLLDELDRQQEVQLGLFDASSDDIAICRILQTKGPRAIAAIQ